MDVVVGECDASSVLRFWVDREQRSSLLTAIVHLLLELALGGLLGNQPFTIVIVLAK